MPTTTFSGAALLQIDPEYQDDTVQTPTEDVRHYEAILCTTHRPGGGQLRLDASAITAWGSDARLWIRADRAETTGEPGARSRTLAMVAGARAWALATVTAVMRDYWGDGSTNSGGAICVVSAATKTLSWLNLQPGASGTI